MALALALCFQVALALFVFFMTSSSFNRQVTANVMYSLVAVNGVATGTINGFGALVLS